jgi:hypothetical protein
MLPRTSLTLFAIRVVNETSSDSFFFLSSVSLNVLSSLVCSSSSFFNRQ